MRLTVYNTGDTWSFDGVGFDVDSVAIEVPDGTELKPTKLLGTLAFLPPHKGVSLGLSAGELVRRRGVKVVSRTPRHLRQRGA